MWEQTFDTSGRRSDGLALLMFNIKALTSTTKKVPVKINNQIIGYIQPTPGGNTTIEYPLFQSICFSSSKLIDGDNKIRIDPVSFPTPSDINKYDDFVLSEVVCFFQQ